MTLEPPGDANWYLDTGASSHLTADSGILNKHLHASLVSDIFVGNGNSIPIHGSGHSHVSLPSKTLQLNNVLYAPQIVKNLIFVRQFTTDNQVSVEFDPFGFFKKDLKTGVS